MNFKLLNVKNLLILSSIITTCINLHYANTSDLEEQSTEYETDAENDKNNDINNNIKSNSFMFSISSSNSFSTNGKYSTVHKSEYTEEINNNGRKVSGSEFKTNEVTKNNNTLSTTFKSNTKEQYDPNDVLILSDVEKDTNLKDANHEKQSNLKNKYNKNDDSSIDYSIIEDGKCNKFNKKYNNNNEIKEYNENKHDIEKLEKESNDRFINRYFKEAKLTDDEIKAHKNAAQDINDLEKRSRDKLFTKYFDNTNDALKTNRANNKHSKIGDSIEKTKLVNNKKYNEDEENFNYKNLKTNNKNSVLDKNINQLGEYNYYENEIEDISEKINIKNEKLNTQDNNTNNSQSTNSKDDLRRSYSTTVKNKSILDKENINELRKSPKIDKKLLLDEKE